MNTIWKFEFSINNDIEIAMPKGALILSVQVQNDIPCIWAKVNAKAQKEVRKFKLYGTGHKIFEEHGKEYKHISTFQVMNGDFVFHLFEILER